MNLFGGDPALQCYFQVTLGPELSGKFMSCSGISYELDMETYQEGGSNWGPHFFPNAPTPQRLVLERGVMHIDQVALWLRAASLGMFVRLMGAVTMLNFTGTPIHMWTLLDAYPVRYEGPTLNAMDDQVAVTRVELMHSGMLPLF